jgi:hypothetical protein
MSVVYFPAWLTVNLIEQTVIFNISNNHSCSITANRTSIASRFQMEALHLDQEGGSLQKRLAVHQYPHLFGIAPIGDYCRAESSKLAISGIGFPIA